MPPHARVVADRCAGVDEVPPSAPPGEAEAPAPARVFLEDIARPIASWDVSPAIPVDDDGREPGSTRIVVPHPHAILFIDYPLARPVQAPIDASRPAGFSERELCRAIRRTYARIYEEEDATANHPGQVGVGHVINRTTSDGVHGIWGHVISDLFIEGIDVYRADDGTIYVWPSIGS